MTLPCVIRLQDLASYSPAKHTGTVNHRVICRETVGASCLEVLIGTITQGHGALKHAHPGLEQASLILQGSGVGEVGGVEQRLGPGQWSFNPQGQYHRFTVSSEESVRVLVIYAPPYAENPQASVLFDEAAGLPFLAPVPAPTTVPGPPAVTLEEFCRPVIDAASHGARHLAVYACDMAAGMHSRRPGLVGVEQVIYLQQGTLAGQVAGSAFEAGPGDFVFIPAGADHAFEANGGMRGLLIHAYASSA